jgi:hypothetical protein
VFNALCATFKTAPKVCEKILKREKTESVQLFYDLSDDTSLVTPFEVFCFIVWVVLINVAVVYCCRRRARREMQNAMNV